MVGALERNCGRRLLTNSIAEYVTPTTVLVTRTTLITFATQYIDTLVTTNVSTMIRTLNVTSSVTTGGPTIPNNANSLPGPSLAQIPLTSSPATLYGMTMCVGSYLLFFQPIYLTQRKVPHQQKSMCFGVSMLSKYQLFSTNLVN